MQELNLCEILRGHEGETFYSPICGDILFYQIDSNKPYPIRCSKKTRMIDFTSKGEFYKDYNGECMLFPSKDQRDWNKWVEEQKTKVPKTWSELAKEQEVHLQSVATSDLMLDYSGDTPIEKSAAALLKIHQLIEVGYGGNVLYNKEGHWDDGIYGYTINICPSSKTYLDGYEIIPIERRNNVVSPIMFKTKEYAEEFIKYEENCRLLRIFNMVAYPRDIK